MSADSPTQVTVFMYQVGFGDCFLVRFHYPHDNRHVLIDFGSFPKPKWAKAGYMRRIAQDIQQRCSGKLDAVVVTHRHADHVSGFATAHNGPGTIIADCEPDLVVQPWTEDPDAQPDATEPTAAFLGAMEGLDDRALRRGRAFVGTLDNMHRLASAIRNEAPAFARDNPNLARALAFHGEDNLKNLSAVKNLLDMGHKPGKMARYVYYGSDSGLERVLPGVKVQVLGPPTLEQSQSILRQAREDPDEFWHLLAVAAERRERSGGPLFPEAEVMPADQVPPSARWLVERVRSLRGRELLEIVRSLDNRLNNTSVILLLQVGAKKLLFPGDAQIENWCYALRQPGVLETLKGVNLYKVGHHGSLNATPKTLWRDFTHVTRDEHDPERLVTIVSTEPGVHGCVEQNTEVPRQPLVRALKEYSQFTTTEDLATNPGECTGIPIVV